MINIEPFLVLTTQNQRKFHSDVEHVSASAKSTKSTIVVFKRDDVGSESFIYGWEIRIPV